MDLIALKNLNETELSALIYNAGLGKRDCICSINSSDTDNKDYLVVYSVLFNDIYGAFPDEDHIGKVYIWCKRNGELGISFTEI